MNKTVTKILDEKGFQQYLLSKNTKGLHFRPDFNVHRISNSLKVEFVGILPSTYNTDMF